MTFQTLVKGYIGKDTFFKLRMFGGKNVFYSKFSLHTNVLRAFKYRDRLTIMSDILKSVKNSREGRKKTQIMNCAHLNYVQTKKYLNYMHNCGFLVVTQRETYVITEKGSRFLQLTEIQKIQGLR